MKEYDLSCSTGSLLLILAPNVAYAFRHFGTGLSLFR